MSQADPREQTEPAQANEPVEERVIYEANPAMFRAHPIWYCLGLLVIVAGPVVVVGATQLAEELVLPVAGAGLGMSLVGLIAMGWWWLQTKRTTFTVTSSRTRLRRGLLSVHMTEVWHRHVRNVQLTQSVWERVFGVGTLSIAGAGKASWDIQVTGLPRIYKAKETIDQYRLAVSHESN